MENEHVEAPEIENNEEIEVENLEEESESVSSDENLEDENESEESESPEKTEAKAKKNGVQKRIAKLRSREEAAKREADYWKKVALENQGKAPAKEEKQESPVNEGRPKADNFDTQEEYIDALTDWKLDQKFKSEQEKTQKSEKEKVEMERASNWQAKMEAFTENTPDFEDAMEEISDVPVSPALQEAILESDIGPEILYALGKDPDEALRISKLSDYSAIKEVGKLEAKLQSKNKEPKKPIKTKAPKPISTVKGSAKVTKDINDPNLTQAEFEALRNQRSA
jgi:hypothetical protein